MTLAHQLEIAKYERKILGLSTGVAVFFIFLILTAFGSYQHWLAHPPAKTEWQSPHYLETEIYEQPKPQHLIEEKKLVTRHAPAEKVLSKTPAVGKKQPDTPAVEEKNQTESGPKL